MSESTRARLERLRGSLEPEEPGARGLERVARNPECGLLTALTIAGTTPATAAESAFGELAEEGQSPFALAMGNRFEKYRFENGAQRLLELYRRQGRLNSSETKVVIIPDHAPGTRSEGMARRLALTRQLLLMKLRRNPRAPNLIVHARLPICLLDVDHYIEPDILVAGDEDPFYRPGEVKSYSDLRGKTNPSQVRGALRQAAVAVVALRQLLERHRVTEVDHLATAVCDGVAAVDRLASTHLKAVATRPCHRRGLPRAHGREAAQEAC